MIVNRKTLFLLLVGFIFPALTLNFGSCYSPNATIPFSYDDLSGKIAITSPIENFTFTDSDIVVNAGLHIGGIELEPDTHYVPYQNISCVYSLDGSKWQNMSLVSVGGQGAFCSPVNPYWYSNTWLNYTTTLHNISGGTHFLRLDVKPDSLSPRVKSIDSLDKASVNFTISQKSNITEKPDSELLPKNAECFAILSLVIATISIVVVLSLLFFKKHRKSISQNKPTFKEKA
jgi:hypothetical protein